MPYKYVFEENKGFAKLVNEDYESGTYVFKDGTTKEYDDQELDDNPYTYFTFDDDIASFIVEGHFEPNFTNTIKKRGLEYLDQISEENIFLSDDGMTFNIFGREVYEVTIGYEDYYCDCPYNDSCKHEYAVFSFLRNSLNKLNNIKYKVTNITKHIEVKDRVDDLEFNVNLHKFRNSNFHDKLALKDKMISYFKLPVCQSELAIKFKTLQEADQMSIIGLLMYDKELKRQLKKQYPLKNIYDEYRHLYGQIDKVQLQSNDSVTILFLSLLYNNLDYITQIRYPDKLRLDKNPNIVDFINDFNFNLASEVALTIFLKLLNYSDINNLVNKLTKEKIDSLKKYQLENNLLNNYFYDNASKSDKLLYLPHLADSSKIDEQLYVNEYDENYINKVLIYRSLINDDKIRESKWFNSSHVYLLRYSPSFNIGYNLKNKFNNYIKNKEYDCFDFSYKFNPNNKFLIEITLSVFDVFIIKLFTNPDMDRYEVCHYTLSGDDNLRCYALEKALNNDEFNAKLNDAISEKNRLEEIKINDDIERILLDFDRRIKPLEIPLKQDELVGFELDFKLYSSDCTLDIKIGNQKYYKVKSINQLAYSFRCNETTSYGKFLKFTHAISNVDSKYQKFVNKLIEIENSKDIYNNRLHIIDFISIIETLEGVNVTVNDKTYNVLLTKVDLRYKITKDYKLILLDYENSELIFHSNKALILDNTNNTIVIPNLTELNYKLLDFYDRIKNKSFRLKKDIIRDYLYSRYNDVIDIDDEVRLEFEVKNIDIEAYFDYHDKKILVNTILKKDNVVIDYKKLTNIADINKYQMYNNYLLQLGFIENEIISQIDILNFFKLDFTYLKTICKVYLSDSILSKKIIYDKLPTIHISYEDTVMKAFLEESKYTEEELSQIMKAFRLKKKFVLLKDDRIVDLTSDNVKEFYDAAMDLRISEDKPLERKVLPTYEAIKAYAHQNSVKVDDYLSNMISDIADYKNYDIKMPNVDANLRKYQEEGIKWLSILTKYNMCGILADDMGLGKTLQIISLIKMHMNNMPSLIVCPKALIFNWKNEFYKFAKDIEVIEIYGMQKLREEIINKIDDKTNKVYITSYDSLSRDIDLYEKNNFQFLIIDEAQTIKNVNAKKSVMVKQIKALNRFALTGTPIENNILDLWSIFDFLMPLYFEELSSFKKQFETSDTFVNKIAKKVTPFILRRTKKEVLNDLPSKYERVITCQMDKVQRKIYDKCVKDAKDALELSGNVFNIFPYLMRLRQICVDPKTYLEGDIPSCKMDMLNSLIDENIKEHKILIFSTFKEVLRIIGKSLSDKNIKYYEITGDTDAKVRVDLANEFNNNQDVRIFLISLKAGGTGLNLIGADMVIHMDPWWNIAAMDQATDRAYRIGQSKNVEEIKLIAEDTVEMRIIELQNLKKDLIDQVIQNNDEAMTKLSKDDIKFILN